MSFREAMIRESKRRILSLAHLLEYRVEKKHIEGLLAGYDPEKVINIKPSKCDSIAFVITRMVRFHGGQTSVLRIGTQLSALGMKVYYLICKPQSVAEMELCASSNLKGFKGKCMSLETYLKKEKEKKAEKVDFVCATSWNTVSFAKKLKDAYKLYFVQDYEPYFYKFGEEFLMCRGTYGQGLHMISLGSWNLEMIRKEAVSPLDPIRADVVDFPYEPGEYRDDGRDYATYKNKHSLVIAVYLKYYGKRLPAFIPYMLNNTARKLKACGIGLEVLYFGESRIFKSPGGTNLGQLNSRELATLYKKADFGMVASMSNISLVPYEMHASGLPVIEFSDGTYTRFLPGDSVILTKITETDVADKILDVLNNPEKLEKMHQSAMNAMKPLSWKNTGKQFYSILQAAAGHGMDM